MHWLMKGVYFSASRGWFFLVSHCLRAGLPALFLLSEDLLMKPTSLTLELVLSSLMMGCIALVVVAPPWL